jgi:hypothetical protein
VPKHDICHQDLPVTCGDLPCGARYLALFLQRTWHHRPFCRLVVIGLGDFGPRVPVAVLA